MCRLTDYILFGVIATPASCTIIDPIGSGVRLANPSLAPTLGPYGIAATSFRDLGEETGDKLQNLPSHRRTFAGLLRNFRRLSRQQQRASCEG
jgi:hypothetical protein